MKRKHFLFLTLAFGLLSSTIARAECQIQLGEAQVNYGQMTRGELISRPGNTLSSGELRIGDVRELDITVQCDRSTPLTLQFIGAARDSESYRFGERGRATLVLHDVMIDDRQVEIVSADKRGTEMAFTAGNTLGFWKDGSPATGTTLRGKVTVTTLMPSDATRVRDRQTWQLDGSFVIGGR